MVKAIRSVGVAQRSRVQAIGPCAAPGAQRPMSKPQHNLIKPHGVRLPTACSRSQLTNCTSYVDVAVDVDEEIDEEDCGADCNW